MARARIYPSARGVGICRSSSVGLAHGKTTLRDGQGEAALPIDYMPDVIDAAGSILEKIYRPVHAYQKCGVILTDQVPRTSRAGICSIAGPTKTISPDESVDMINSDDGLQMIHLAIRVEHACSGQSGLLSAARAIQPGEKSFPFAIGGD